MDRIGILTYHWVANYGANLQMYSTYIFLKNQGYNPIVINWIPECGKRYYETVSGGGQMDCHLAFLKNHCDITREFSSSDEYESVIKEYNIEAIIVGSDSLFNIIKDSFDLLHFRRKINTIDHKFPNPFWCYKTETPHVALSVSSQNASYRDFSSEAKEIARALNNFKIITVRDTWTRDMVSYFTKGKVIPRVTPDPVFGFNNNVQTNETAETIRAKYGLPEKYILFTFNEGRMKAPFIWILRIKELFNKDGYSCIYLPRSTGGQKLELDYEIKMPIDPLDWYNLIRFSNGYVGVLMHPIIVCLHNAVPCFSFDHYGKGPILMSNMKSSKIYHIMNKADLLDNHYFLRNHIRFPQPEYVYEKIKNFPIQRIRDFSDKQSDECLANMRDLVNALKQINNEQQADFI